MSESDISLEPQITEIFMPRDYWIPDAKAKMCHSCKTLFDFFTWKHHCRMCGNVFDSKCSNNFVFPPFFYYEEEKKIRLCNDCYPKAQNYLEEGEISPVKGFKRGCSRSFSFTPFNVKEMEVGVQTLLTRRVYELSNIALEEILKENGLFEDWYHYLKGIVKECMETIQPHIFFDDNLNFNDFIKIKKIPYKDQSLTQFVRGVVIHKNVLNKRMSNNLNHPIILMFKGNLDSTSDDVSIMDSPTINREKNFFEETIKKILELDPHIIITEGRVGRLAQDMLAKPGKTIIAKMKERQFERVADALGCIPLSNWNMIEDVGSKCIGSCGQFSVVNHQNKMYYEEYKNSVSQEVWENFDTSLMFFERCFSQKDATILLSGPNTQTLVKLKACLKQLFPILRSIFLERGIISQEISLLNPQERIWKALTNGGYQVDYGCEEDFREKLTIENYYQEKLREITFTTCLLNESAASSAGYMLKYLTERYPFESLVKRPKAIFSKFVLIPLDFANTPDLYNTNATAKVKLGEGIKNSTCWHRNEICQIEKDPQIIEAEFWDKEDVTLGNFLLGKVAQSQEKCPTCYQSTSNHITFFLANSCYIKVESDFRGSIRLKLREIKKRKSSFKEENTLNMSRTEGILGLFGFGSRAPSTLNKSVINLNETAPLPDPKSSFGSPTSTADIPETVITMYIECSKCNNRLSEFVILKRNYLEYSLTRYLENLIHSAEENLDYLINNELNLDIGEGKFSQFTKNKPRRPNVRACCAYSPKNRVFIIDDFSIKFRVGFANPYSFDFIHYKDPKSRELVKIAEESLTLEKKAKLLELQKSYIGILIDSMKKVLNYLSDRSNSDLTLETVGFEDSIVSNNNQLKDPYNVLLLEMVPLYQRILNLRQEIEKDYQKEMAHHFDVDRSRKEFYEKLLVIADFLERSKDQYLNLVHEFWNKPKKDLTSSGGKVEESMDTSSNSPPPLLADYDLEEMNAKLGFNDDDDVLDLVKRKFSIHENGEITKTEKLDLEKELQYMEKFIAGTFTYYEENGSNQPLPLSLKYDHIPIYDDQILSVIAYSLNSPQYMGEIYHSEGFLEHEEGVSQKSELFKQFIDSKLLFNNPSDTKPFVLRIPAFELEVKYLNHLLTTIPNKKGSPISPVKKRKGVNLDIIEDIVGLIDIGGRSLKEGSYYEKLTTSKYQVILYYPVQFEALRNHNGIDLKEFILSLSSSRTWVDNTGGKTGAGFIKTYDQRFVFKELDKKEFTMLLEFVRNYFEYLWRSSSTDKQMSLLMKIYGAYEIHDEKKTRYFIAMENLFFGMGPNVRVYDLKGSEVNRYITKKEDEKTTLLDTNFKVDRNGAPIPIKAENYAFIERAIKNDSEFLASQRKVDYSLLLMFDEQTATLRMGIIDYLRNYDLEKQLEFVGKRIIKGTVPTIISPDDYKERFKKAMKKYFIPVHQS